MQISNPCNLSTSIFGQFSVEVEPPTYVIATRASPLSLIQSVIRRFPDVTVIDEKYGHALAEFAQHDDHLKYENCVETMIGFISFVLGTIQ